MSLGRCCVSGPRATLGAQRDRGRSDGFNGGCYASDSRQDFSANEPPKTPVVDVGPPLEVGLETEQKWLALPAILWLAVGLGGPLSAVVLFSFWTGTSFAMTPELTISNYQSILGSGEFWGLVLWTLIVLLIVLTIVTLLGVPVAYFLASAITHNGLRAALLFGLFVPFVVSYVIRLITWLPMFGRAGLINRLAVNLGILSEPSDQLLFSPTAIIIALVFLSIAFFIGPLCFKLLQIDRDLISAAQNLSATPTQIFRTIELPLARQAIFAGWLFVSVIVLTDFAVERVIGGGLSPMLAGTVWRRAEVLLWPQASAYAVVLIAVTFAIVGLFVKFGKLSDEIR